MQKSAFNFILFALNFSQGTLEVYNQTMFASEVPHISNICPSPSLISLLDTFELCPFTKLENLLEMMELPCTKLENLLEM